MSYSILVVEDDAELRNIYRRTFEQAGYTMLEASNGAEALDILAQEEPHIMVLDMLMPTMSGDTVLRRLQSLSLNRMKVVVITAYSSFRDKAEAAHADAFLVKPVQPKEILQTIQAMLEEA